MCNYVENQLGVLSITDLAELICRMGYDYNPVLTIIQNSFKKGGDYEVKKIFKLFTELEIDSITKGKYVIIYNYQ